ncbi:endo alpha-1,4 polygalactosaminidase [Pseudoxanthobacter sp. M-2]|uniref:endo alpha-1,4 polygalactosaminidase n=1 Tax=Pseudoxanthobacter sp. M-2 TaxID=3078754 RepID=UPI0038FCAA73
MIRRARRWLPAQAQPLLDWLDEYDPGGVDAHRALHFVIAVVLAIVAGRIADTALGLGQPVGLPLYCGIAAGTLLFLLVPGRRGDEAAGMVRLAAVLVGYVALVALLGGAGDPLAAKALTVLLVPLTFLSFYVRRFGRNAQNAGIALFEMALIVATTTPTREEAIWFAIATAGGATIALAVRLVLWRPLAVPAFEASVVAYRMAAAAALTDLAAAFATGAPWPAEALAAAATGRRRLRRAAIAALREAPEREEEVQDRKGATYRLEIASELIGERLAEALSRGSADGPIRAAIAAALLATAGAVRPGAAAAASQACSSAITAAQTALLRATDIDVRARDRLLVALAGVARIAHVAAALDQPVVPASPIPAAPPPPAAASHGLLQTTRVAIQGLVATVVTTAIYLGFGLDHGYWATLTVAFVLGGSFGETVARARTRLTGTVVGVAAGMAVGLTIGDAVGIGATLAVAAMAVALLTMRDRYDVSCACVAFAVLLGLHLISGLGAAGMIARLYDTAIGAAAALVCARFVLPVALTDPTRAEIGAYLARCRAVFARLWPAGTEDFPMPATTHETPGATDTPATLAAASYGLRERLPRLNDEAALGFRATEGLVRLVSHVETIATYLTLIDGATSRLSALPRSRHAVDVIGRARDRVLAAFDGAEPRPLPPAPTGAAPPTPPADDAAVIGTVEYTFFADALERALTDVRTELTPAVVAPPVRRRAAMPVVAIIAGALAAAVALSPAGLAAAEPSRPVATAAAPAALPTWDWIIGIDKLPSPPPAVEFLGLDGFDTPKRYVVDAGKRGIRTWCYLSVGTIENWRPDRKAFEALNEKQVKAGRKPFIGKRYPEWEGERWLDVRRYKVFLPLMVDRLEMCRDKGFEFVEFDNLDAYENKTGFTIRKSDTVRYAEALAAEARRLGLKPMQKNVPELAEALEPHFDALLFEDCALYRFCGDAKPFVAAGKPVFDADYPEAWKDEGRRFDKAKACEQAKKAGVSMIFKRLDLDAWVRRCD